MRRSGFERFIALWAAAGGIGLLIAAMDIYTWFWPRSHSAFLESWAPVAAGVFIGSVCMVLFGLAKRREFLETRSSPPD